MKELVRISYTEDTPASYYWYCTNLEYILACTFLAQLSVWINCLRSFLCKNPEQGPPSTTWNLTVACASLRHSSCSGQRKMCSSSGLCPKNEQGDLSVSWCEIQVFLFITFLVSTCTIYSPGAYLKLWQSYQSNVLIEHCASIPKTEQ